MRVALCPTCNKSFPPAVRQCPDDGTILAATGTDQTIASGASGASGASSGGATVAGKSGATVRTQSQAELTPVDELAVGAQVGEYR